jgi:hypothetical protein
LDGDLTSNIKRDCRDTQAQLTEFLGSDEVISMALERWGGVIEEDEAGFKMTEGIGFIARTVESLFDLLSTIRSLRREHILVLEMSRHPEPQTLETRIDLKFEEAQSTQLIEHNISAVRNLEKALKEQEGKVRRQGQPAVPALKRIEKERERMEEWRLAVHAQSDGMLKAAESKEVGKIQMDLARALSQ